MMTHISMLTNNAGRSARYTLGAKMLIASTLIGFVPSINTLLEVMVGGFDV